MCWPRFRRLRYEVEDAGPKGSASFGWCIVASALTGLAAVAGGVTLLAAADLDHVRRSEIDAVRGSIRQWTESGLYVWNRADVRHFARSRARSRSHVLLPSGSSASCLTHGRADTDGPIHRKSKERIRASRPTARRSLVAASICGHVSPAIPARPPAGGLSRHQAARRYSGSRQRTIRDHGQDAPQRDRIRAGRFVESC